MSPAAPPPRPAGRPNGAAAFRCGHVAVVGRPNVGKSTLTNRLVGARVSITSKKPQTTRHRVAGILTTADAQLVFADTPGFQTRHRSRLNERMNRAVTQSLTGVDAAVVVIEAGRTVEADRAVIRLVPTRTKAVVALNKVDALADKRALLPQIAALAALRPFAAIVPVSAESGYGIDALVAAIRDVLPEGPPLYAEHEITDRDERFLAAEFIREKIFRLLGEEVPYESTVVIDRFVHDRALRRIHASVVVDRDNQKGILLGAGGAKMKEIASKARADMETLFGGKVLLEVFVRVKKGWTDDDALLKRLGY